MEHLAIYRLQRRKRELERLLRSELARRVPDHARISELKRRKLALKDEIAWREALVTA